MSGDTYERELCNIFRDAGWHAQRAASSGAGTDADLPDVTIAEGGRAFAIEAKTVAASESYIYVDSDEVDALRRYADAYGQIPLIAGRWKQTPAWQLWIPERMAQTDSGTYRGAKNDSKRRVTVLDDSNVPTAAWLQKAALTTLIASDVDHISDGQ
jgi:Holliday junction resolvase